MGTRKSEDYVRGGSRCRCHSFPLIPFFSEQRFAKVSLTSLMAGSALVVQLPNEAGSVTALPFQPLHLTHGPVEFSISAL